MLEVRLEPDGETLVFPKMNTVLQLMNKLGISQGEALIIRDGHLLTPDLKLGREDRVTVRKVVSRG